MKRTFLTGLTIVLTGVFSLGLLSAAENGAPPAKNAKKKAAVAAAVVKLLPPELHRSLNLIPEDAFAAGFVNTELIVKGKLFPQALKTFGMDLDTLLAQTGGKKEDADCSAVFFFKMKLADPNAATAAADAGMPSVEVGGATVFKRAEAVSEQFAKSAEQAREEMLARDPSCDAKIEKTKIADKDAFIISMPSQKVTAILIAAARNVVQFRVFFNTAPVAELIPARGNLTPLAGALALNSSFSLAVDGVQARALSGEVQDDAMLKTIQRVACSVTEKSKGLSLVFRVASSDVDGVQLIKTQIETSLAGFKENPVFDPIVSKTKVTVEDSTTVVVRSFIPSEAILQYLALYAAASQGEGEEAEEEEPAAPAADTKAKAKAE